MSGREASSTTRGDDEATGAQNALQPWGQRGSDGGVCPSSAQDTPLTLQCEGGQANTYILHANNINLNVTDCQVVQLGNNNQVIIDNDSSRDKLTLTITHREPNAGECIPNGQSRSRALDKASDASVEVGVLRGGQLDRRVLDATESEYEISVSVVRQPLSETEGSDSWTAENACIWESVKPLHAGTRLFLFGLFGPMAIFKVTFTLERRRMATPSKHDYLNRSDTFWDEVCKTNIQLENTGERRKFRKKRPVQRSTQNRAGEGGDLAIDYPMEHGRYGKGDKKRNSSKNSRGHSSSEDALRGRGAPRDQAFMSADLTVGPSAAFNTRNGNNRRSPKPGWHSTIDSSDEENQFGQRTPRYRGGSSGDIVTDSVSPVMNTRYGSNIKNKKLFKSSTRDSSHEVNQFERWSPLTQSLLSGDIATDSVLPAVRARHQSDVRKRKSPRSSLQDSSDEEDDPKQGGLQGRSRESRGLASGDVFPDAPLVATNALGGFEPRRVNRRLFDEQEDGSPPHKPGITAESLQPTMCTRINDDYPKLRLSSKLLDGSPDEGATCTLPCPSQTQISTPAIPFDMDACAGRSAGGRDDDATDENPNLSRVMDEIPTENPLKENLAQQQSVTNVRREDVVAYGKRMEEERGVRKSVPLKGQCKTKKYGMIKTKLTMVQNNGDWEVFDKLCRDLLGSLGQGKKDYQCMIMIQQGEKQYKQNELDQAMKTFQEVIRQTDQTDNPELLRGRTYFLLANVFRKQRKLGLAQKCLDFSEGNIVRVKSDEDKAEFYNHYGSFLTELLNITPKPSRELIRKAKECFRKEFDIANETQDERARVESKRSALLKIAFLLLDCRNQFGRTRAVPPQDVQEAKECLDMFENELWYNIPKETDIQFTLARSDQFYRQGNHARALNLARAALDNIERYGFTAETSKAQERIQHLTGLVQEDAAFGITAESLLAEMREPSEGELASGDTATEGLESGIDVLDPNFAV